MDSEFWHERWKKNEIGFHQENINAYLKQFSQKLHIRNGQRIFVPLCGKSRDMLWLQSQGYSVIGTELSPLAVEAFFNENGLQATQTAKGKLTRWQSGTIEVLCGDFFDVHSSDLNGVTGVYDRASLIALPPEIRECYARHLISMLPPQDARILLITMEYPKEEMQGPPFTVTEKEVKKLYGLDFQIEKLLEQGGLENDPYFKERGLTRLTEKAYLLSRIRL